MKITNEVPTSWKDLQDKVCKYLNQAGYQAESPKTITTVRGDVEVDVFVTAKEELLKQFICECKFWDTPVPKEKIHAFRTVVQDSGSMLGIFISKNGYQKGAIEAACCSNVLLKDWNGFIDLIAEQWLKRRFKEVVRQGYPLGVYTDPLDVSEQVFHDEKTKARYEELVHKYLPSYLAIKTMELGNFQSDKTITVDGVEFNDFNSLFEHVEVMYHQGILEFEDLFSPCPVEKWKLDISNSLTLEPHILNYLDKKD